ncbi:MAG: phosphoribosylanthranilate isomerase [Methanomassiliicoccales archaeon]|nr:MAG: phosphoribosylanthranilate isomerase [Methanomassiliicoccales archaeon]
MTEVKVCGMMRRQDVDAGSCADYLGFVVSSSSRRCLSSSLAKKLMSMAVPKKVMVTNCPDVHEVVRLADELRPDVVQAHRVYPEGELDLLRSCIPCELWLLMPVSDSSCNGLVERLRRSADKVVLDTPSAQGGGSGQVHDWRLSSALKRSLRPVGTVLAGGLCPSNVREAIRMVRPDVVDVSTGVEEGGRKSPRLIAEFISNVRGGD